MNILNMLRTAERLEAKGFDTEAFRFVQLIREANIASTFSQKILEAAPKESEVEITSWPDFLSWFQTNRGQNLVYVFIDTYGAESPEAQQIASLVEESNKHESALHQFYMDLRNKAKAASEPQQQQQVVPPPAQVVEPTAEPVADEEEDESDTDTDIDLDSVGDEEDE